MKKIIFFGLASLIFFVLFELFSFSILKIFSKFTTAEPQLKISSSYKYIKAKDIPEKKNYHAFYGWRGYYSDNKFKVRQTLENKKWNNKSHIYFFGGSTVLGAGTTFDKTIPSHFADLSHYFQPINMGEHSYVSGQSLNRLIEIIDEINKNDIVIFYEGVNDVVVNCQKHLGVNGHSRVSIINKLVKDQNNSFLTVYNNLLRNFQNTNSFKFINGVSKKIFNYNLKLYHKDGNFICNNKTDALKVAKNMIRHWSVAETISKKKGAKFYAFLQPSPYTADFELSLPSNVIWKKSHNSVYPILRKLISDKENYYDLSKSLNKDFYVDWCCHMHSDGNEFISNTIFNLILK